MKYQDRGNRFEGLKSEQVSAYDIEIVSAMTDFEENSMTLPDTLRLRFNLENPEPSFVIVRDLDLDYGYWLDHVKQEYSWKRGFENEFSWPTADVLQHLKNFTDIYSLGVVVRMFDETPKSEEIVAPAILFYRHIPDSIKGYIFAFKTSASARLVCNIFQEQSGKLLFSQNFPRILGGEVYVVHWMCTDQPSGWYKLIFNGFFRASDESLNKTVRFFHQRFVK